MLSESIWHTPKWEQQPFCCVPSGASCWDGAETQLKQCASNESQHSWKMLVT